MREQLGGYMLAAYVKNILFVAVGPSGSIFSGCLRPFSGDNKGSEMVIAISTDNGVTWTKRGLDGGTAYSFRGNNVMTIGGWATGEGGGSCTWLSLDDGLTWKVIPQPLLLSRCLPQPPFAWCSNGNILGGDFPWAARGLFLSTDSCASTTQVSDIFPSALLALPHGGVLVGTDTTGIYFFSDNGDSIKTLNEDLTDLHLHAFAMDSSGNIYAGTNNGVWRRPLSSIVSVSQPPEFPTAFRLEQNYPNPFNPNTIIKFELPKASQVSLTVYDMLGREVSVLVNEKREAGVHEVKFEGSHLASGVYFYRLQAGDYVATKKLLLMK